MRTLTVITFLFLLSCTAETQNQNAPDQADGDDIVENTELNENNISEDTFSFPQLQSIEGCIAENVNKGPSLCEWGLAANDIVLLEITKTSLLESPVFDDKTQTIIEVCDGTGNVTPGFRMEGIVHQSINSISGKITIDVGLGQFSDHWDSIPLLELAEDGGVKWSDSAGIKVGDVIGLTLHKDPDTGTLGVLGEHFFDINEKNTIRFGELDAECGNVQPKDASGLTFAKLREEIKKCVPTAEVDARRQAKEDIWRQSPVFANVGTCYGR